MVNYDQCEQCTDGSGTIGKTQRGNIHEILGPVMRGLHSGSHARETGGSRLE